MVLWSTIVFLLFVSQTHPRAAAAAPLHQDAAHQMIPCTTLAPHHQLMRWAPPVNWHKSNDLHLQSAFVLIYSTWTKLFPFTIVLRQECFCKEGQIWWGENVSIVLRSLNPYDNIKFKWTILENSIALGCFSFLQIEQKDI